MWSAKWFSFFFHLPFLYSDKTKKIILFSHVSVTGDLLATRQLTVKETFEIKEMKSKKKKRRKKNREEKQNKIEWRKWKRKKKSTRQILFYENKEGITETSMNSFGILFSFLFCFVADSLLIFAFCFYSFPVCVFIEKLLTLKLQNVISNMVKIKSHENIYFFFYFFCYDAIYAWVSMRWKHTNTLAHTKKNY